MGPIIRYEFWNGQTSQKKKYVQYEGLVTTKHNPCLWTNVGAICEDCIQRNKERNRNEEEAGPTTCCTSCKPWRGVYTSASEVLCQWERGELNDTELLHHLRFVAYGIGKREFDDTAVIWPGNLTSCHRPKLSVEKEDGSLYTIRFTKDEDDKDATRGWKACREEGATFYWSL